MRHFIIIYLAAIATIFAFIIGASTFGFAAIRPNNPVTAAIRDSIPTREIGGRNCYEIVRMVDGQRVTVIACEEGGE